jgi:hypothetical protein
MPAIPNTRPDDRRGQKGSSHRNPPHERNEQAAQQIEALAGFGMPQDEIQVVIEAAFGPHFSRSTIHRHYDAEIQRGKAKSKAALLNRSHQMALGQAVPAGVTPDRAYQIAAAKLDWLLSAIHGVKDDSQDANASDYAKVLRDLAANLPV